MCSLKYQPGNTFYQQRIRIMTQQGWILYQVCMKFDYKIFLNLQSWKYRNVPKCFKKTLIKMKQCDFKKDLTPQLCTYCDLWFDKTFIVFIIIFLMKLWMHVLCFCNLMHYCICSFLPWNFILVLLCSALRAQWFGEFCRYSRPVQTNQKSLSDE